ncbi:MAG: hypothetical protein RI601_02600, partial [Desulfurivibrionaceae bacterium]|nr:hypothetical protein [Desulfurivibrionaceae bacterium]
GQLLGGEFAGWMQSDFAGSHPYHSLALELTDFQIGRFIKTFRQEKGAAGTATFITQLNSSGKSSSEIMASLNGQAEITCTDIMLYGLNIDEQPSSFSLWIKLPFSWPVRSGRHCQRLRLCLFLRSYR